LWSDDPCDPPDEPQAIAAGTPTTLNANTATVLTRTNCALTMIPRQNRRNAQPLVREKCIGRSIQKPNP
jgi:hypothetical protein